MVYIPEKIRFSCLLKSLSSQNPSLLQSLKNKLSEDSMKCLQDHRKYLKHWLNYIGNIMNIAGLITGLKSFSGRLNKIIFRNFLKC